MREPVDPPPVCPVCETAYDSVSVHQSGLLVNLLDNERYRRVCFEPVDTDDAPAVQFYHHTHEQVDAASGARTDQSPVAGTGQSPVTDGTDDTESK
jgi:hypothetical protein